MDGTMLQQALADMLAQDAQRPAQVSTRTPGASKDSGTAKALRHVALQLGGFLDAKTTRDAIKDGRGREANPLMRGVMSSDTKAYVSKIIANGLIGLLMDQVAKTHPKTANIEAGVLGGEQALLALHNSRVGKD